MARGKKTAAPLKASTPNVNGGAKGNKKTAGVAQKKQKKQMQVPAKAAKKSAKVVKQPVKEEKKEESEEEEEEEEEQEGEDDEENSETEDSDDADDEEDDEFEDQGSSSDDDSGDEEEDDAELTELEKKTRRFTVDREKEVQQMREDGSLSVASQLHVDDLSSDDEENVNTIGNVPLRWYEEYDHIGFNVDGKKIMKSNSGDGIDDAIAAKDDPNYDRTVYDAYNDRKIVISDRDMEIIRRMQAGAFAHPEFEAYPDYVDIYSSNTMIHSMGNDIEPKSRFLPSKWERMKVMKIMKGIKEGRIKLDEEPEKKPEVYQMWFDDDQAQIRKGPAHVQAPKMPLPGHIESYNPPDEYLFTKAERRAWEEAEPDDRETNFIPKKFKSLREVCGYSGFVRERFERCLDLYLAPRVNKRKLNIDPESLVPELPKPQDLRPFPNTLALVFNGHTGRIRSLAVDPYGQYVASGSDDFTVRIWELETARCLQVYKVGAVVHKLSWNPNKDHQLLAVAAAKKVFIIATGTGSADQTELTNALVGDADDSIKTSTDDNTEGDVQVVDEDEATVEADALKKKVPVTWRFYSGTKDKHKSKKAAERPWLERRVGTGIRVVLHHTSDVKDVAWHNKGDYLSTVAPGAGSGAVLIHQISKRKTQNPFQKSVGQVQCVLFHPSKPFFFHATQRHVRVYNLVKQSIVKKLSSGVKWISSMAVHPNGDHLLVGSYDRRLCWFDLDLSSRPFKTLKYHEKAVRDVSYHAKYPLMASASDDGTIHIFHAMVYSDLMKNPLIVPLKILRGHEVSGGLGVMALAFHPVLPWVVTGGADGSIRLFQNIH
ncbi:Ribosome biogenesis protein [Phytophthora fragariae]|uniref:Ribosome biogenesis protein BOP1 homolog n=1 Tax=Phytophthora fragariae TaxID=53985 RepID=A0A6A3FU86_9STRA|nr:Ribosome biogenesis protein [Phytophthora fragariae]KAE8947997.1 Ribosome biogenesis protein [Phytophthora fragariae]KAE9028520.1 Ribosome biogenesis protein [Phytophthora fragariae]KAE9136305.1 Ribosome biogenesis protein [Phytophthora fragariae]KAE9136408.1 Ribosome biogenesis protein [Phytophthora fragariae]